MLVFDARYIYHLIWQVFAIPLNGGYMGRSQRLTVSHVREVFRLLGETRELGASPAAWRAHFARGACKLVGADIVHAAEMLLPWVPETPRYASIVIEGELDSRRLEDYVYLLHNNNYRDDPCCSAVARLRSCSFTRSRQQLADDRTWYGRPDLDLWRAVGTDQMMYSHQYLGDQPCIHAVGISRGWGKPAFTRRECRVIQLLQNELGRLWRRHPSDLSLRLSPRLRQTWQYLLAGASEKEIACVMDISRNTVHDYTKAIYKLFEVKSHVQLVVKCARSGQIQVPLLCCTLADEAPAVPHRRSLRRA